MTHQQSAAPGFLVDHQIRVALESGQLIEKGTWEHGQIRHASYQLRLGDRVEIARSSQASSQDKKELAVVRLTRERDSIDLSPGDTALLYSIENLRLPDSILGFTVARGLLFVESLVPENTYIDPGFSGALYTTVTNISNRVITLKYGTPIARMFLYRLPVEVEKPYSTGAAIGITQQLDSVPASAIPTLEKARSAKDRALLDEIRRIPIGGLHIAECVARFSGRQEKQLIFLFLWPVALLVGTMNSSVMGLLRSTFLSGVLASMVAWLMATLIEFLIKRLREQ